MVSLKWWFLVGVKLKTAHKPLVLRVKGMLPKKNSHYLLNLWGATGKTIPHRQHHLNDTPLRRWIKKEIHETQKIQITTNLPAS